MIVRGVEGELLDPRVETLGNAWNRNTPAEVCYVDSRACSSSPSSPAS